jgi:hypothetical protein
MPDDKNPVVTVELVSSFLKANADKEEVKVLIEGLAPKKELKPEEIKKFLSEDEEGKKLSQTMFDQRVNDAITTGKKNWEANRTPEIRAAVEEEIMKKHGLKKSDEQKQIDELKAQQEKDKKESLRKDLRILAKDFAIQNEMPPDLIEHFIGDDEASTKANLKKAGERWKAAIAEGIKKHFKDNGGEPPARKPDDGPDKVTEADVARLAEIAKKDGTVKNIQAYSEAKRKLAAQQIAK